MRVISHRETFVLEATIAEWERVRELAPTIAGDIGKRLARLPPDMHRSCKMKMPFTAPVGQAERTIRYLTELARSTPVLAVNDLAR